MGKILFGSVFESFKIGMKNSFVGLSVHQIALLHNFASTAIGLSWTLAYQVAIKVRAKNWVMCVREQGLILGKKRLSSAR